MKRHYIPFPDRLAAALACLLPQGQRDQLRADRVPAEQVIALFEQDHIELHALGGSDAWWNLHPTLKQEHRTKSARDTSIVAKVKRLEQQGTIKKINADWLVDKIEPIDKPQSPQRRKYKWPSRPFPKRNPASRS